MSIRANISKSYRWRIGIVGIAALGFAAYCFYDGFVAYPAKQAKWQEYDKVIDPDGDGVPVDDFQNVWQEYAESKGWDGTSKPKKISDSDIMTQFFMGIPCTLVGLYFTGSFLMMRRRFVETDDQAVWDHRKNRATWDQITDIDKSRWQNKGIGVIRFNDGDEKKIVLDDWKYDRNETQRIMAHVEAKVGGGTPEDAETTEETSEASDSEAAV